LTEYPLAAREPDDVVDGEEVGLVAQLGDEPQFVFDKGARFGDVDRGCGSITPL
jgi:hypothetical protein